MDRQKYINSQDYRAGYDTGVIDGRKQILSKIIEAAGNLDSVISELVKDTTDKDFNHSDSESCENCSSL